jgi:hypothetical protein
VADSSAVYSVNQPNVVAEVFEGEVVVVDLVSGRYFSLLGTGALIWDLLSRGHRVGDIAEQLVRSHAEGGVDIPAAVGDFIESLVAADLIVQADPSSAVQMDEVVVLTDKAPFASPTLETFSDLQDILLLDPIHEVDAAGWPVAQDSPRPRAD